MERVVMNRMEKFMNNKLVPQTAVLIYEEAKRYFGEDNVELCVGYKAFATDSIMQLLSTIAALAIRYDERGGFMTLHSIVNTRTPRLPIIIRQHALATIRSVSFWTRLSIVIRQPERIIRNEKGESIKITDLFIRIPLAEDGKMRSEFKYIRTSFTENQAVCGYVHSHCPTWTCPEEWSNVCLGTGPIRNTILAVSEDPSDMNLRLFFWELDKIIGVESEQGGPYRHLRDVNNCRKATEDISPVLVLTRYSLAPGTKELLKSYLKFGKFQPIFRGGEWTLNKPFLEWLAEFSDYAMAYSKITGDVNIQVLFARVHIHHNKLVRTVDNRGYITALAKRKEYEGTPIIHFKGTQYTYRILEPEENETEEIKSAFMIRPSYGIFILYTLLQTLNLRYNAENNRVQPSREKLIRGIPKLRKVRANTVVI